MSKRRLWRVIACILPLLLLIVMLLLEHRAAERPAPEAPAPTPPAPSPGVTQSPSPEPSPEPSPAASPAPSPAPKEYEGAFELPLEGATGFASIDLNLRSGPSAASAKKGVVAAGSGFRIIRQEGDFWYVTNGQSSGYVAHKYCMINLPDVIPSIVYDNTNSYGSRILSSGKTVPGITGKGLYDNKFYNPRLGMNEFIMPVLYSMAPKIHAAQQAALADGNSLKIYEAYRPYQVQRMVVDAMDELAARDAAVRAGISTSPWKISWFVSQGISHHQRGCAIDVSIVKVERVERRSCGAYSYENVVGYTEYEMPTAIHELSIAAAVFTAPVQSSSKTAWRSATLAKSVNNAAKLLQKYCTDAGMTPLASEWWHFNDLDSYALVKGNSGTGRFVLRKIYSAAPD